MDHNDSGQNEGHARMPIARRDMLARCGMGMGTLGLAGLIGHNGFVTRAARGDGSWVSPTATKRPHFAPRAKRVIHFFLNGGPSQVDTFDPKPMLDRYDGKPLPTGNLPTEGKTGGALASPFKFRRYGQSGIEVSEL